jgi:4-diphosphocytidyl-2C-methyl-D-erythritol kinase
MSGSGPAVFGLVSSRKEAYAVAGQLKARKRNWDVFVAKTV